MPTYEYKCASGHEFECFQRMSDDPVTECPECGAEATRLLSAGGGFLFKGEGFYITDYRSDDYKKSAAKDPAGSNGESGTSKTTPAEGSGSNSSSSSTESSPATSAGKSETKSKGGSKSSTPSKD